MNEIRVHATDAEEARAEGAAALGVSERDVEVEVLEADEHGITARVYTSDKPALAGAADNGGEEAEQDAADRACRCLKTLLELAGVEARVQVAANSEDEVLLNVVGDDLGVIIGSFGQTLNAVQFLLNLMVNRGGRRQRITVDAGGYRDRRRERLEEIAHEHARRAKDERRGVILEGLRASERRIIHTALQNDPDVVTFSEGEEPHRRLIISPRNR